MRSSPDSPLLRMVQEAEAERLKAAGKEFNFTPEGFRQAFEELGEEKFENLLEYRKRLGLRETDDIQKATLEIDKIIGTEGDHKWGDVKPRGVHEEPWQYFYDLARKIIAEEIGEMPPIQVTGRGDKYWVSGDGRHRVLAMRVLRKMNWPVLYVLCELNPLGR